MSRITARLELKLAGADAPEGTIEGYGSVFGNIDSHDDIVVASAFDASLAEHRNNGTMPALLWQHDPETPIGVWSEMVPDGTGLRVKGRLILETARGKEAYALLKAGALNGLSIGFRSRKATYDEQTWVRTISEAELWEVSLVTFPANKLARASVIKALNAGDENVSIRQMERLLRDEAGLSASQAKALLAGGYAALVGRDGEQDEAGLAARDAQPEVPETTKTALMGLLRILENSK